MRFGTYEAFFDNLPHMLSRIVDRNLESYYDVFYFRNPRGGPNILESVRIFQFYLPVMI
jgi:hypothetical protein